MPVVSEYTKTVLGRSHCVFIARLRWDYSESNVTLGVRFPAVHICLWHHPICLSPYCMIMIIPSFIIALVMILLLLIIAILFMGIERRVKDQVNFELV